MKSNFFINGFGICTSTGENFDKFSNSLFSLTSAIANLPISNWPKKAREYWKLQEESPKACTIQDGEYPSSEVKLISRLEKVFSQISSVENLRKSKSLGIIYASTKGAIEDFVWKEDALILSKNKNQKVSDPLQIVLDGFIEKIGFDQVTQSICISNACASSHAAIFQAKFWIESNLCEDVLILAADEVGPFISTGFKTLKALATSESKPFSKERDGLMLGEAACILHFSNKESKYKISGIEISNEAHAVTAPSSEGRGLFKCIANILKELESVPDLGIAHGTGTIANDLVEDHVFSRVSNELNCSFPITATKWSVGHCLGASGLVDLIAAIACLERGEAYQVKFLKNTDHLQSTTFLTENKKMKINSILISSLGFGGTNSALVIEREISCI